MDGSWHRPVGVRGWTHVVFRRESDGARRVMSLDQMLAHLDAWDRTSNRRVSQRRVYRTARDIERRLIADRRAALGEVEHLRRRESDFASLDAELPPAPKGAERPVEERVAVERETPLPLAREGRPPKAAKPRPVKAVKARPAKAVQARATDDEPSDKPAKRKRRQPEGPPKPRKRRPKSNDDELNPNP
jgi:hypothetical protein